MSTSLMTGQDSQEILSSKEFIMAESFRKIIEEVGENPKREGLLKTPQRAARALNKILP